MILLPGFFSCARNNVVETPAIPAPVSAYAPEFARRLGLILRALAEIIARRLLRDPRFVALIVPLCGRINRAVCRCERLMAGLAAGRLPKPRLARPGRAGRSGPRKPDPLPRGRGWLIRVLGHEAAGCASQLQALLAEPEAAELLALVPAAAGIIRPLGRMLDPGARARPPRAIQAAAAQYCALPPMLSPEWGRRPETEPWHRHHIRLGKTA
jgi:hypothetical protein